MQKKFSLFVLSLLLVMLMAACSTPEPEVVDEPETSSEVVEESADDPTSEPEEVVDDSPKIFTWAESIDPFDLDPRTNYDAQGLAVLGQAYETLTHFNSPGSDVEISPELATSWESNEDATVWTFQLRDGVTFHDGTPFNAEAVKAVVENVRDGDFATSWIFGAISEIEAVDDLTVTFTNAYPAKLDLIFSSAFGAWMVSPAALAEDTTWFTDGNTAGTGPYKIASRETGTRIVMEKHEAYWGEWNDNKFDTVVFEYIADETVREQMIRAGDADLTQGLDFDNLASLEDADGVAVQVEQSYANQFIMLNAARPPLDNPLVRQALAVSYPYQDVLDNLVGGLASPAGGAIPATMWGADANAVVTQDLDKARELLAEAGMADGFEMDYWAYEGLPIMEQIGEVWLPVLRDLGITLNITTIDFNAAMESFGNDPANAHHAVGLAWFPTYVTPFDPLFSPFATGEYFNLAAYENPDFDDLIFSADGATALDQDEASALFQEANQMLVDDAAAIFAFDVPQVWQIRDDLSGYSYNPAYSAVVEVYNLER